jgi:hypothetical protein
MSLKLWFSLTQMNQLTTVYVNRVTSISTSLTRASILMNRSMVQSRPIFETAA